MGLITRKKEVYILSFISSKTTTTTTIRFIFREYGKGANEKIQKPFKP